MELEFSVSDSTYLYRAGPSIVFLRIPQGSAIITTQTQEGKSICRQNSHQCRFSCKMNSVWLFSWVRLPNKFMNSAHILCNAYLTTPLIPVFTRCSIAVQSQVLVSINGQLVISLTLMISVPTL